MEKYYEFFVLHKLEILLYYTIVSLVLFLRMWKDKKRAIQNKWRTTEFSLFLGGYIGGFLGGFVAMFAFHHKTRKIKFYIHFALAAILHLGIWFLFLNQLGFFS